MKKKQKEANKKAFFKTQKGRLFVLTLVLIILAVVLILSIVSIVWSRHAAEVFVQKYQHIDQSKFRAK